MAKEKTSTEQAPQSPKSKLGRNIFIIVLLLIAAVAVLSAIFFYNQYLNAKKTASNTSTPTSSEQEKADLIEKIGKLIELPQGEIPTLATVSDVTKLSGETFFAHAQNGDKVLIYKGAKKAILFRPSTGKIIEVGPVAIGDSSTSLGSTSPTPDKNKMPKVLILNGTASPGLAKKAATAIKNKKIDVETETDTAKGRDYKETLIVDFTKNTKLESDLVNVIGGKVINSLPEAEDKPDADILIIIGQDYTP